MNKTSTSSGDMADRGSTGADLKPSPKCDARARWPHLNPLEALLTDALEGVMRAAELGDYLRERCSYSYGDRHTQPEEFGIEWHWQQSTPDDGWGARLGSEIEAHLADVAETEEDLGDALLDWQRNPILVARAALDAALQLDASADSPAAGRAATETPDEPNQDSGQ
jgi:hypothetical protein